MLLIHINWAVFLRHLLPFLTTLHETNPCPTNLKGFQAMDESTAAYRQDVFFLVATKKHRL